jgi:hypothetical protein
MNDNLTLNALTYTKQYSDQIAGSARNNASLGSNLPRVLRIVNRDEVNGKTKLAMHRTTVLHEQSVLGPDGVALSVPVTVQIAVLTPKSGDPAGVDSAIDDGIIAIRQLISGTGADAAALNLATELFKTRAQ